jgi:hypothetical protein
VRRALTYTCCWRADVADSADFFIFAYAAGIRPKVALTAYVSQPRGRRSSSDKGTLFRPRLRLGERCGHCCATLSVTLSDHRIVASPGITSPTARRMSTSSTRYLAAIDVRHDAGGTAAIITGSAIPQTLVPAHMLERTSLNVYEAGDFSCSRQYVIALTWRKVAVGVNRLTYFDMRGRAEAARLMLYELAGVDFEDCRVRTAGEWQTLKPSLPFGSLPMDEDQGVRIPKARHFQAHCHSEQTYFGRHRRIRHRAGSAR